VPPAAIEILLAEDERVIREAVAKRLSAAGYSVRMAADGIRALELYREKRPDLLLLDVMMPGLDGFSVCERVRKSDLDTPVVFLTALDSEADELKGFETGADGYVSKTVSCEIMLARIAAAMRRRRRDMPKGVFPFARWQVDAPGMRMYRTGTEEGSVKLSEREVAMLRIFASYPGEVISRDFLVSRLWGPDGAGSDNALTVAVKRCREKLGIDGELLEPVRGCGYVFRVPRD
jgi:DNA-binding response OmpR family regulator